MVKAEGFREKGLTSKDTGVYIPPEKRAPHRPEYLHMSKAEVQKAEKARLEDEAKVKEYRNSLKKKKPKVEEAESPIATESKIKQVAKKKKK